MSCHWLAVGNCIIGPVHPLLALCDEAPAKSAIAMAGGA